MNLSTKQSVLQGFQVVLYNRALHPCLFDLKGRKVVRDKRCELEAWVLPGQHILRFEHKNLCLTELMVEAERRVPQAGIVTAFLCVAERDFEQKFDEAGVKFMTTVQTETLSDSLYRATYSEMVGFAKETQALSHRWEDEAGTCLSIIDIQRMNAEVHVQCYHLIASGGLVLRTQSLFEHGLEVGKEVPKFRSSGVTK